MKQKKDKKDRISLKRRRQKIRLIPLKNYKKGSGAPTLKKGSGVFALS